MENVYIKAYTEVSCLLKYLPDSYINRLPKKFKEFIEKQVDERYIIDIDVNKELTEQNFSEKTKDLIAVIKYNYWSTNEEKQKIRKKLYENEIKYQNALLKKYNNNNIFKEKDVKQEIIKYEENMTQIAEYKESKFRKFINKIKKIFRK